MPDIPPLPAETILLVEVGSTAHGTGLPGGEDHDELGVVMEEPRDVLGLNEPGLRNVMQRTQPEGSRSGPGDTDRTIYSLRRFVRLAGSGNPSIMVALWAPVLLATEDGRALQALGGAFVGRHIIPRYRGYMLRDRRLALPMADEPADWLRSVRRGEVSLEDWWHQVLQLDAELESRQDDDAISSGPDREAIEAWSVAAHLARWAACPSRFHDRGAPGADIAPDVPRS